MKTNKPTIAARIEVNEMQQIDALIQETGQSRSEWLHQLIKQELGQSNSQTVRSMGARIATLERKLARLAN
ncbi:ribbon-helix-helix protein, CopG family [Leptolyngbya sp. FACHB-17]|uniref:ribbon-helix-helix protein, CopG family n=1 Tax=unclassified Leptolyngbya TaxID=2650499 RepID=UPI0016817C2A|nr:ribbon-helix-helix protein, CopG family [Leptolyngbya sp. FACHB-17]MBD2078951.1 ribbon-helix-helix protein, CopG family [Leptolyngbya sp. FACHB-17]